MPELLHYISERMHKFVQHSSERFRDILFWKIWERLVIPVSTLIYIDYSENLSIPIRNEPQPLYFVRKQISLLCCIIIFKDDESGSTKKIYSGYLSDDLDHDQVYVRKTLDHITSTISIADHLVIRSDNAMHFKSAENFADLQQISNVLNITVIRVFGIAGHGKGEIDSCGGHMKNPVRKGIANKVHITTAEEAADYLNIHYENHTNPSYLAVVVNPDELQAEREERLYIDYKTVSGSNSFHVLVFKPHSTTFMASKSLCVCSHCTDLRFEECDSFTRYEPLVGRLNEKATRSKSLNMAIDQADESVSTMVTKGSIFAVRADNDLTNYFLLQCTTEEKEHLDGKDPAIDQVGNVIHYGTKYITGKYLEVSDFNDKYHVFDVQRKNIFVAADTVFFPQVPLLFVSKSGKKVKINNEIVHELQIRSSLPS